MGIIRKWGQCPDCPPGSPDRPLISGRCKSHYWIFRANQKKFAKNGEDNQILQKIGFQTLTEYYNFHISRAENDLFWICENCKTTIYTAGFKSKLSCQAHILPKKLFPSVKTHPENHMLLGGLFSDCGCHNIYDNSWLKASKMSVFTLAIKKFNTFKMYLSEKEISILPEPFIPYL